MRLTSLRLATLLAAALTPTARADAPAGTVRVSISDAGVQGDDASGTGFDRKLALSADGRYTAFTSVATNLVPGDTNAAKDVFLRDALAGTTTRVSLGHQGQQANGRCDGVAVSDDGRFVAYSSIATNLVPSDTNGTADVFLYDATTGTSQLVSRATTGGVGNGSSEGPTLSADGRYVCFWSGASNLVGGDTNGVGDIFVYDRILDVVVRVNLAVTGGQANANSRQPYLSRDGAFVSFQSYATNLSGGDTNGQPDIFVRTLATGAMERITLYDGPCELSAISSGGRWVAFDSTATNVVGGDTNGLNDVFVHDRVTGATTRVSVSTAGAQSNGASTSPDISADGVWVAFESLASNLVPGDTNGASDGFVRQQLVGWTERVTRRDAGGQANGSSYYPVVGAQGRHYAFLSSATNLVTGDTNASYDVFVRDRGMSTGEIGAVYCESNPNSTGAAAWLEAKGSPVLADNLVLLRATLLPANKPGYFLMSDAQAFVPLFGGSQGNLCLGSPILRFSNDLLNSGNGGTVTFQPNLTNLPQGQVVHVGEVWNFQLWYRDVNPATTSNTSAAVCVELL